MGLDFRGIDKRSGLRLVSANYQFSGLTMLHGGPGGLSPTRILNTVALPAPVAGTPRVLTRLTSRLLVPMPMVLGLATNTTAGSRSISVRFTGYDTSDNHITETLTIPAAPASSSALSLLVTQVSGLKTFARVTKAELLTAVNCASAVTGPPAELGDTIKAGPSFVFNPRFGFPAPVIRNEDVLEATLWSPTDFAGFGSRGIDLLEGTGLGNTQFGTIDLPNQQLVIANIAGFDILTAMFGAAFASYVQIHMLVRSSQGFTSGPNAYDNSAVSIPSYGD